MTLPSELTPTPAEVLTWDVSGLPGVAADATAFGNAVLKAAQTMHDAIYALNWSGAAKNSADGRADRELTTMRALTSAYDLLADCCTNAHNEMEYPLAEIKTIFRQHVAAPVVVHDDWSITGVTDWNSEAGQQLSRIAGLWSTLYAADFKWGLKLSHAHFLISTVGSDVALKNESAEIKKIKSDDPNSLPDNIATNPTSFWAGITSPDMTASTIEGAMTEGVRMAGESVGENTEDAALLKWVKNWGQWGKEGSWSEGISSGFSRVGVIGSAISTVPSILDDIHDGESPTEAITADGGGTAAGLLAGGALGGLAQGAIAGTEIGSVVPGVGNIAGLAVGALAGGAVSYVGTKWIKDLWN